MTRRFNAWGTIHRTELAAWCSAEDNLNRLAASTRRVVTGGVRYEECRKTPTGWQARVSGVLQDRNGR